MKKPYVGQDIHFHPQHGQTVAAKVTKVWSPYCVNLVAFDDGTLGAATVSYISVSWATSYGYANGFSYVEDSPEYKAAQATPKMDFAVTIAPAVNPDPATKTEVAIPGVTTSTIANALPASTDEEPNS